MKDTGSKRPITMDLRPLNIDIIDISIRSLPLLDWLLEDVLMEVVYFLFIV